MHYLLFYEYSADYLDRRGDFREEHLTLAWEAQSRGELILGGALADPADGAVVMFQCSTPDIVEQFVAADPYVKNGLVASYRIRPWSTVVGRDADTPIKPEA